MSKLEDILDNADESDPIVSKLLDVINNYTNSISSINDSLSTIDCLDRSIEIYVRADKVGIEPNTREKIYQLTKELTRELQNAKFQINNLKKKVSAEYSEKVKELT